MKMKKSFIISSLTALAAFCLCVTARAQGPVVVSDKDDYSPGEAALFQAAGFQPDELLDFSVAVQDENGLWVPDIAWADVAADASGGAVVDYVVPETWLNKSLQLTVMGLSSGLMAQTTFTDSGPPHQVVFFALGLPNGTSINVNGTYLNNGGSFQSIAGAIGTPAFITPAISNTLACQANPNTPTSIVGFAFSPLTVPGVGGHYELTGINAQGDSESNLGTLGGVNISTGSGSYATGAANPGHPALIFATYTFFPETTNQPPHITCTGNDANFGAVVGCLGTGTGFGQTFPVSYTQSGTNPVTVTATFTLPDSSTVPVTVATISDPDAGDTVTVTLSGGTSPVVISGPGSGTAPFTLHIDAHDNHNLAADNNPQDCGGNANAQIVYNFNGFFPPLNNNIATKVKRGSGVPVKFSLTDCSGNQITTGDHTISVAYLSGTVPYGDVDVDDTGASGDNGINFRYDPTGMQWIFNLKTNSSYSVGDTYQIAATLDDETTHNVSISIK